MAYSWKPEDVFRLLGISVANRAEQNVTCPKCGSKHMGFNMIKGIGKCWKCEFSCDSAGYYAVTQGLSLQESRKDIEDRLGIKKNGVCKEELPPRVVFNTQNKEDEKASPEILDDTYRAFLAELTLSDKNRLMLNSRGLTNDEIDALGYRTLPHRDEIDFFALCRRLQSDGHVLKGVPGFYKAKSGDYTFVQFTKGVIMPLVNIKNQIIGLQIRKDDDLRVFIEEQGDYEAKCVWFSSKNREGGCSATAGVHYACDFKFNPKTGEYEPVIPEDGVMLTEGIMKADISHFGYPNIPVISVPGVNATTQLEAELKKLYEKGVRQVWLAYDMDYLTNPNVQKACAKTIEMIERVGMTWRRMKWENHVVLKDKDGNETELNINGIDDYIVYTKYGIIPRVKHK